MKERSTQIIGKSNTGKTRNILFKEVENEIKNENDLLILDSKLEYYNHFKNELDKNNYEVIVINFKEPLKSDGWDPLEYINYLYDHNHKDKAIEIIKKMGLQIFKSNKNIDPFWENSAADYFTGIIMTLLEISKQEIKHGKSYCTFASIYNIMNQGEEQFKDSTYLKTYCNSLNTMSPTYMALSTTINSPNETRGSIISVVKQKLNTYFMRPELLNSFYENGFSVGALTDRNNKKKCVFIVGYEPLNTLTNILITFIYDSIIRTNKKMTFVLDGFDELPKLLDIESMINKANEGNIKLFITTRNIEKLSELYDKYTFSNIEKTISLSDKFECNEENITAQLPDEIIGTPTYINFKEYIEKNFK